MSACGTQAEFERMLKAPAKNEAAIRATLCDRSVETWTLATLGQALRTADEDRFVILVAIARPHVSKKRVARVLGTAAGYPWTHFFRRSPSSRSDARQVAPPAASADGLIVSRGSPHATAPGRPGPVAQTGSSRQQSVWTEMDAEIAAKRKEEAEAVDRYLQTKVQCRECLHWYKRAQLPNPRRRVCGDCGGQPRSNSVSTVSGGSPSLGRRR